MSAAEIQVDYLHEGNNYSVYIHGPEDVLAAAQKSPATQGKEGEALVEALLAAADGRVDKVVRYKDGYRNDGPNGEAAFQEFKDGQLWILAHYKDDELNDTADGDAASQEFDKDKNLILAYSYDNGHQKGESSTHVVEEMQKHKHPPKTAGTRPQPC